MLSKKILAIVFLMVLLIPPFAQNFAMGQNEPVYCPETVEKKYCHKVIIIGAGMAGLGAANELKNNTYDVIVLESNPKSVGGRVITWNSSATHYVPLDLHASYISGTTGNPITELAQKYDTVPLPIGDESTYYDNEGIIRDPQRLTNLDNVWSNFTTWLDTYRINKTEESLQIAINKFNDTLNENDKKDFSFQVSSQIGNEYADDPKYISLLYWDKIGYVVGGELAPQSVFPDGYSNIPKHLANDLGDGFIQYKTKVTKVSYDKTGVQVDTDGGPSYYGKYVICTIPINLLQEKKDVPIIKFDPLLPQNKTDAINKMKMGTLAQTYIYFKNGAFWNNTTDYISYIPPMSEAGHWTLFLNMYKIKHQPILMAFNYGDYARHFLQYETNDDIKQDLSKIFRIMNGSSSFDTKSITILYRGEPDSYSTSTVGFKVPDDYDMLASPVADGNGTNRVFFAGEATTWHYPATTHGAFLTGLREANRVMVTDTGEYPSPHEQEKNWRYPARSDNESPWLTFPEYVMCKPGLNLIAKASDNTPACVFENDRDKLVSYGWAKDYTQP
ncbi:MAG: FAD-dependent oxidoreductase [Thaumarchaeota archaeon]|nr:FAD-dependent oxidoreductase [Nitrososphaerota archaeon]